MSEGGVMYYDRQGKSLTLEGWAELQEDEKYRAIAWTKVMSGDRNLDVSTIWLGLDHGFGLGGPPVIFETMIFGDDEAGGQWRYSTEAEAVTGHKNAVNLAKGMLSRRTGMAVTTADLKRAIIEGRENSEEEE